MHTLRRWPRWPRVLQVLVAGARGLDQAADAIDGRQGGATAVTRRVATSSHLVTLLVLCFACAKLM